MITEERIKELLAVDHAAATEFYDGCSLTMRFSPVSSVMAGKITTQAVWNACETQDDREWFARNYPSCATCGGPRYESGALCFACRAHAAYDAQNEYEEYLREREEWLASMPVGYRKGKAARRRAQARA